MSTNAPPFGELRVVEDVAAAFADVVVAEAMDFCRRARAGGSPGDGAPAEWVPAGGAAGGFRVALSGGATARSCYDRLAGRRDIEWAEVECFLGDERCVPPDDADANQRMIRETLIEPVGSIGAFYPMDCDDPDGYAAMLATLGPLHLVHLGLGPDGHTASLFPGSTALDAPPGRLVVRNTDPSGNNPHERLTLTFDAIARADLALFTVAGESKREALGRVLAGDDVPAARVRAGRVLWLVDREAVGGGAGSLG